MLIDDLSVTDIATVFYLAMVIGFLRAVVKELL